MFLLYLSFVAISISTNLEEVEVTNARRRHEENNHTSWQMFLTEKPIKYNKWFLEVFFNDPRDMKSFSSLDKEQQMFHCFISIDFEAQLDHFKMVNRIFSQIIFSKFNPYKNVWATNFILYSYLAEVQNFQDPNLHFNVLKYMSYNFDKQKKEELVLHRVHYSSYLYSKTEKFLENFISIFYERFLNSENVNKTIEEMLYFFALYRSQYDLLEIYEKVKSKLYSNSYVRRIFPEIDGVLAYLYTKIVPFHINAPYVKQFLIFSVLKPGPCIEDCEGIVLLYLGVKLLERNEFSFFEFHKRLFNLILKKSLNMRDQDDSNIIKISKILSYVRSITNYHIVNNETLSLYRAFKKYLTICKVYLPRYIDLLYQRILNPSQIHSTPGYNNVFMNMIDFDNLTCLLMGN